tara:strand:+ start:130 stop:255 length:126 start_codon:yes stop_codon:yes gene_type:complete
MHIDLVHGGKNNKNHPDFPNSSAKFEKKTSIKVIFGVILKY